MPDPIRTEYLRDAAASFRKQRALAETALERVPDAHFFLALDAESNSLAVLVKHMAGNLRSRWTDPLTTDGEKPWRERDAEFEIGASDTREALMAAWSEAWELALAALAALTPADLEREVRIRGEPHSLVRAVNRQLTHAAYHAGQIVYLAKHLRAGGWDSLSIPRGESARFLHRPPEPPRGPRGD